MSEGGSLDVWVVLDQNREMFAASTPAARSAPAVVVPQTRWQRVKKRARAMALDTVATLWWVYVVLQLFVVDIRGLIAGRDTASVGFFVIHRVVPLAAICLVLAVFFWGWKGLRRLLYVAFFPVIVLCWKLPPLLLKTRFYRNTVVVMAVMNAALLVGQNLRYHLISKSLGVVALALIISSNPPLIMLGAALVFLLLVWALTRVVMQTFRGRTFVTSQQKLLSLAASTIDQPLQLDVAVQPDGTIPKAQVTRLVTNIQNAAVVNRLLYLWAYKLQQYRESSFILLFNGLSFASFFLGATVALFLLNLAVLRGFPHQYVVQGEPSVIAVLLYALSSLAFADGGGITAAGDLAFLLRILAGVLGPGFLLAVAVNTLMVLRGSREEAELRRTVQDLRRRAQRHEANFRQVVRASVDEACDRLTRLGVGNLLAFVTWLRQTIPPEFMATED